jgi:hypothetical protein
MLHFTVGVVQCSAKTFDTCCYAWVIHCFSFKYTLSITYQPSFFYNQIQSNQKANIIISCLMKYRYYEKNYFSSLKSHFWHWILFFKDVCLVLIVVIIVRKFSEHCCTNLLERKILQSDDKAQRLSVSMSNNKKSQSGVETS